MIPRAALGLLICLLLVHPAKADQGVIAAYGISVDVTSSDAVSAREKAVLEGQRAALNQVLGQLAQPQDVARLPALSDAQITDMVADYEVESEKVSSVRYIGRLTFRFRADALGAYLQQAGLPFSAGSGPPALILPVLTKDGAKLLFDEGNDWRQAWAQHAPPDGLVALRLPKGDPADSAAITADQALAGDLDKLQALAARYGAGEVVVAAVQPESDGISLSVKTYAAGGPIGGFDYKIAGDPDSAYLAAIDRTAAQAQQDWIEQNRVSSAAEQHLTVEASFGSLGQWADMNRRLQTVATLKHVDVVYLTRGRAELDLVYIGDRGQLQHAMSQRALSLQDAPDGRAALSLADGTQP